MGFCHRCGEITAGKCSKCGGRSVGKIKGIILDAYIVYTFYLCTLFSFFLVASTIASIKSESGIDICDRWQSQ